MTLLSRSEDNLVANVFPVGMQNSELVLQDEEGNSVVTELDELSSSVSDQNFNPTAINVENSSDVIIGPVTQFHGPVTIYQHLNGQAAIEEKSSEKENTKYCENGKQLVKSESSDSPHAADRSSKISLPYCKRFKYIGIPIAFIVIISIIACAVMLLSKSEQIQPSEPPSIDDNTDSSSEPSSDHTNRSEDNQSLKPLVPGSMADRTVWHGHPPLNFTKPLKHPVPLVIISHTATPFCKDFEHCSKRVKSIQEDHIDRLGSPDIGYNFLIGGDAIIYVGRGWDIRNFHSDNTIGICFIGNYIKDTLTEAMISSAKKLLAEGVRLKKLSEDYRLVCHNQTFATLSPGRNVYSVVKTWPHFDPSYYVRS